MKRLITWGMAMMMVTGLALGGCASQKDNAETPGSQAETTKTETREGVKTGEGVKLTIWIPGSGDATYDEAWHRVLESYGAENTGFQYELTFIPWGEYFTKLNAAFSGGVGPDLFGVGYGQLGALQHNGNLLALNENISPDWDGWTDIPESILSQGAKDGDTYGFLIPDVRTLLYRTDIAEENGVTEDELRFSTIEELKSLAEKMTVYDEKGNVKVAGLELRTSGAVSCEQNFFIFSSWFGAGEMWNSDLTANFAGEGNVKALQLMQEMLDDGVAVLNETGDGTSQLVNGIAAMSFNIEATLAAAKLAYPDSVKAVAFDMDTLTLGTFYSVNAKSKYPKEAADLMAYVFGSDSQKVFAEVMGHTPSRSSLADWFIQQDSSGDNEEIIRMYEQGTNYSDSLNYEFLNLMSLLRAAIEDVLYNKADAREVLQSCAEEYNGLVR